MDEIRLALLGPSASSRSRSEDPLREHPMHQLILYRSSWTPLAHPKSHNAANVFWLHRIEARNFLLETTDACQIRKRARQDCAGATCPLSGSDSRRVLHSDQTPLLRPFLCVLFLAQLTPAVVAAGKSNTWVPCQGSYIYRRVLVHCEPSPTLSAPRSPLLNQVPPFSILQYLSWI